MAYGFVYIMINEGMSNAFKIGCTERAPTARAEELSNHTGVPAPFKVLCYIEVADFQQIERKLHEAFQDHRISSNREFFYRDCIVSAVASLYWYPYQLSFAHSKDLELLDELEWDRVSPLSAVLPPSGWKPAGEVEAIRESRKAAAVDHGSNVVTLEQPRADAA
jgi:hypothetical protein